MEKFVFPSRYCNRGRGGVSHVAFACRSCKINQANPEEEVRGLFSGWSQHELASNVSKSVLWGHGKSTWQQELCNWEQPCRVMTLRKAQEKSRCLLSWEVFAQKLWHISNRAISNYGDKIMQIWDSFTSFEVGVVGYTGHQKSKRQLGVVLQACTPCM